VQVLECHILLISCDSQFVELIFKKTEDLHTQGRIRNSSNMTLREKAIQLVLRLIKSTRNREREHERKRCQDGMKSSTCKITPSPFPASQTTA